MTTTPALHGWLLMAGVIPAIGAQNALVLRLGLLRRHVGPVVLLCAGSDMLLIVAGVYGVGRGLAETPWLMESMRWLGAAFVFGYAALAARRAWRGPTEGLVSGGAVGTLGSAVATTLAMTYLNPHVYIDTLLLVGVVGASHGEAGRAAFAAGASIASAMWFLALGFGAAALAPWLRRPTVWRAIDACVAVVMLGVGLQLLTLRL